LLLIWWAITHIALLLISLWGFNTPLHAQRSSSTEGLRAPVVNAFPIGEPSAKMQLHAYIKHFFLALVNKTEMRAGGCENGTRELLVNVLLGENRSAFEDHLLLSRIS